MPCYTPSKLQPERTGQCHSMRKVMILLHSWSWWEQRAGRPYQYLVPHRESRMQQEITGIMVPLGKFPVSQQRAWIFSDFVLGSNLTHPLPPLPSFVFFFEVQPCSGVLPEWELPAGPGVTAVPYGPLTQWEGGKIQRGWGGEGNNIKSGKLSVAAQQNYSCGHKQRQQLEYYTWCIGHSNSHSFPRRQLSFMSHYTERPPHVL